MTGTLEIRAAGPMLTVQDRGRPGFLRFGVSASGPMDAEAFAAANALVGNAPGAALLEFALTGGRFRASRDVLVAVTGGEMRAEAGARPLAPWSSARLRAGEELTVGALRGAVWGYLAVSGGIETPPVMGARATHLRSAIGGLEGRALRPGDVLPLGPEPDALPRHLTRPLRPRHGPIRVVLGPQDDAFAPEILARFLGAPYAVSAQRDRMAMLLEGPALPAARGHDITSDGTLMGSVQVPPSGRPIVLMADRQTTGGFPKIATVITPDLGRLAQLPTGAMLRFHALSVGAAEAAARAAARQSAEALADLAPTGA